MFRLLRKCLTTTRRFCTDTSSFMVREPKICTVVQSLNENPPTEDVVVRGWISSIRKHKNVTFLHLQDGTTTDDLQIVALDDLPIPNLTYGSSVEAKGRLVRSPYDKQEVELSVEEVKVLGSCDPEAYPFKSKKMHDIEYRRQFQHLRPRNKFDGTVLRLRHEASRDLRSYLTDEGFYEVHTPIMTTNDCEGAGYVFKAVAHENKEFFDKPSFLTVSAQFHLEALSHAIPKVFTFGPILRADHSKTRHHLSEFYMLEIEMAFCDDLHEVTDLVDALLSETVDNLIDKHEKDLKYLWKHSEVEDLMKTVDAIAKESYQGMTYTEAVEILQKHRKQFDYVPKWGEDFGKEHERFLVSHCNQCPVFVEEYPIALKPFYMKRNVDGKTVKNVDLLYPHVGEVCGGSVREDNIDNLKRNMEESGIKNIEAFEWYLDLRRFGSVPHCGLGIGFDRFLQALTGIKNIKDIVPFPRSYDNSITM
ncbi:DgyrCDS7972 [Dimorphilus gyrociliatus]|uniref:asparagine--tRNA ligase n=1 Tax=Dimorphilus gyrociliatus TaxID=2664684 RepID=A0A7I8VSS5_9ANNE|nr:DgyrCDS7972 [Dimorphilus gyrociliatus]